MADSDRLPDDDTAYKARLAALKGDLAASRPAAPGGAKPSAAGMGQAMNLGARVMTEFVAAVAVGGFIGWQIDHALGTTPVALIVFIGLGTAAGFWSVYRVATKPGCK